MAEPILYHRAPAFIQIYARALERLPKVFRTENQILSFAASGSGAMESGVANLVGPGEPVIVASCGKFGERWIEPVGPSAATSSTSQSGGGRGDLAG